LDEVAWVCAQCGQGQVLDPQRGLNPLEVRYSSQIQPGATGRPVWVAEGKAAVERATFSGDQNPQARKYWSQPRRFFVPAFTCPIETLIKLGAGWLDSPPPLQAGPPAAFAPVTLLPGDAAALAEFIVVGVEAGRSDKLKEIQFQLELPAPELWILP
jgi:hypothetical protein